MLEPARAAFTADDQMNTNERIDRYLSTAISTITDLDRAAVASMVDALKSARLRNATVFLAGNGGSAATASHFATDLQKSTLSTDAPRLRCVSLADNVALLTAWANDHEFARVFAEPLENLARPGDVLIAISASGNSPNIVSAVEAARRLGMVVIGLSGFNGGRLRACSDISVHVPVDSYELAEDAHLMICHLVTVSLKAVFLPPAASMPELAVD